MLKKSPIKDFIPDNDLALKDFLEDFSAPKNQEPAKKPEENVRKNVTHSISSGKCFWKDTSKNT